MSPALSFLNCRTRKGRVLGLGSAPPGLDCIFFTINILKPGGPPTIEIAGGLFREKRMLGCLFGGRRLRHGRRIGS